MATGTGDGQKITNGSATTAAFALLGGAAYSATTKATSYGTKLQLEILAFDGTTWLNVGANITADGVVTFTNLPPGQYRFELASVTGLFLTLTRIPT